MRSILLLAFLCTSMSISMTAQSIYYNYEQDNVVRLELNRPIFKDAFAGDAINFFSFDAYLNGEFKIGESNKIAFELPFSRISVGSESESNFGNISVAYQLRNLSSPSYFEFKLRIPSAGDDSFSFITTDYTERFSANFPVWSLEPSFLYESGFGNGGYFRVKPGAKLLFDDDDNIDDDIEVLFDLSGVIGYRNGSIDINGGFTSTTVLTEDAGAFSDRSLWQAFATVTYNANQFQPGLIFRLPINSIFQDIYSITIGVQLGYRFGGSSVEVPTDEN